MNAGMDNQGETGHGKESAGLAGVVLRRRWWNSSVFFFAARAAFALFLFLTSVYCVMAYIPFIYFGFLQKPFLDWAPLWVKWHPHLYWTVLVAVSATLAEDFRRAGTRRLVVEFLVVHALAGVFLFWAPPLSSLSPSLLSLALSMVVWFPLAWLALIDHAGCGREFPWAELQKRSRLALPGFALAGLFAGLLFAAAAWARLQRAGSGGFGPAELAGAGHSLFAIVTFFIFLFVVLEMTGWLAGRFQQSARAQFYLVCLLVWAVAALVFRRVVFESLAINKPWVELYSLVIALAGVLFVSGLSLRLARRRRMKPMSGVGLLVWPVLPAGIFSVWARALWLGALAAVAFAAPIVIGPLDWNLLFQKLTALAVWAGSLVFFVSFPPRAPRKDYSRFRLLLLLGFTVVAYTGLNPSRADSLTRAATGSEDTPERYAAYDPSYRIVRELLTAVERDDSHAEFYEFLERNTNMALTPSRPARGIELAENFTPATGEKPHIFLFVLDSLRQDYLSPYNKAVSFTPAIESFARESVVLRKAFTRYGGTALGVPSIWTGCLLQHKLYSRPFYPLNALQKLVDRDGYESYVTVDPWLRSILRFSPSFHELNQDAAYWTEFDLCTTVQELEQRLDQRADPSPPVFFYTLAQNLHLVTLHRNKSKIVIDKAYTGFQPAQASQVEVVDGCFGGFIRYLKQRGWYDKSIVILTADHGDSLGESGRWGHTYGLFPEVLRIPLIIHLPPALRETVSWDAGQAAFSTDITPSLYYLLGHRPVRRNEIVGRPLFTETEEERRPQASHLVASSYGAIYGVLHDNGDTLFIVNALARRNYLLDLTGDSHAPPLRASEPVRRRNEALIRSRIEAINKFFEAPPLPRD